MIQEESSQIKKLWFMSSYFKLPTFKHLITTEQLIWPFLRRIILQALFVFLMTDRGGSSMNQLLND